MICDILKCCLDYICKHKEIIVAIFTLFVSLCTLCVTKEISFNQQWNTLVSEYRSTEFGVAIKAICDFYIDDCSSDLKQIESKYKDRYDDDMALVKEGKIRMEDTVHFKRRLVSQYYWHLENSLQRRCICLIQKNIKQYFNDNEIKIMKIVYKMNEAAEDPNIYREIKINDDESIKKEHKEKSLMNENIHALYNRFEKIFNKSK